MLHTKKLLTMPIMIWSKIDHFILKLVSKYLKSDIKDELTTVLEDLRLLVFEYFIQEGVIKSIVVLMYKCVVSFSYLTIKLIVHCLFLVHLFSN